MTNNTLNELINCESNSKKKKTPKSYHYRQCETPYLLLYPVMVVYSWIDTLVEFYKSKVAWSEKRTLRVIKRVLSKNSLVYPNEKKILFYFHKYFGHAWASKCTWYDKYYAYKFDAAITQYFVKEYTEENFTKEVIEDCDYYSVIFTQK